MNRAAAGLAFSVILSAASPVTYKPAPDRFKYAFGVSPPIAALHSGDILETDTIDSDGHALDALGRKPAGFNPLTGPFRLEGAEPGDTLAIRFLSLSVTGNIGYGDIAPDFGGAIVSNPRTPMLGPRIAKRSDTCAIDNRWPRFENADYIMAAAIQRPVDDARRIAFTELDNWMHRDYGLSEIDAYELLSKVAEVHIAEMADPDYVAIANINRRYLPHAR